MVSVRSAHSRIPGEIDTFDPDLHIVLHWASNVLDHGRIIATPEAHIWFTENAIPYKLQYIQSASIPLSYQLQPDVFLYTPLICFLRVVDLIAFKMAWS